MEYRIVSGNLVGDLMGEVNLMLARGWKPLGGAFFAEHRYFQTLVRD